MIAMIVGDGDEQKGNRTTIFNPAYKCFGGLVVTREKQTVAPLFFSDTINFKPRSEEKFPSGKEENRSNVSADKMIEFGKEFIAYLNTLRK